jgi:uncharacterized membrane protein YdjX (TVP38/TMEM64 family)
MPQPTAVEEPMGEQDETTGAGAQRSPALKVALAIGAAGAVIVLARSIGQQLPAAVAWIDSLGFWGPLIFVLLYAAATVLFVPGALLTVAGGAIFGLLEGTVVVFGAAMLGSGLAFLSGRYVARSWIESRLRDSEKFAAIDHAVGQQGLKIVFLLRLSPIIPFNLINYALGLTRISFRDYMLAGFGMLPGTLLYVYYGRVIGDVALLAGGETAERGTAYYVVTAVGLAATIAVTTIVTRIARRALHEASESIG